MGQSLKKLKVKFTKYQKDWNRINRKISVPVSYYQHELHKLTGVKVDLKTQNV